MRFRGNPALRWIFRVSIPIILPPLLWIGWIEAHSNFGIVQPDRIFRSGQMPATALARTIHEHGIKTVLNLRGVNESNTWYLDERDTTIHLGATQIDVNMSSCQWLSRDELKTLIRTLETCDYPLLIHCHWGSERTALISAFSELLRPGSTLEDARAQFTVRHLYVPVGDGTVMAHHLDAYQDWLSSQKLSHSPDIFRRWALEAYESKSPSRDEWPYDPYPLRTVTRPDQSVEKVMGRQLPLKEPLRR